MLRARFRSLVALAVLLGACSVERAPSGRPGSAAAAAGDSVVSAEVYAALRLYYARLTARDWKVLAQSFWPRATITAILGAVAGPAGSGRGAPGHVETITIEEAIRQAALMKDCPARFVAELTRANVVTYGPLADAWATYRVTCGVARDSVTTHYGIDAIHLMRHAGEWRIAGLTFTHEIPGAPLGRP
ncbi:MAG: hypothetical protein ABSG61_06165 [Gemmatimonadales bacterium]